jgi:hypothetical protein
MLAVINMRGMSSFIAEIGSKACGMGALHRKMLNRSFGRRLSEERCWGDIGEVDYLVDTGTPKNTFQQKKQKDGQRLKIDVPVKVRYPVN